jgi:hypothetical protein
VELASSFFTIKDDSSVQNFETAGIRKHELPIHWRA